MAMDTALVTYDSEIEKNRELIRKTIAPHLKTDEFELFMAVCKEVRLNPIIKQIYPLATWDSQTNSNKLSIQTSIDGLRLLAERSGDYAGQIGPEWCGKDGQWKDVWVEDAPPVAARVGVLRKSFMQPLFSVAKFKTYAKRKKNGELMYMWESMPDHMLAKCAESLALRRAFPHETCGLYTREEMAQATIEDSDVIEGHVTASEVVSETPARTNERPVTTTSAARPVATEQSNAQPVSAKANRAVDASTPRPIPTVNNLKSHAIKIGIAHNLAEWQAYKNSVLGQDIKDGDLQEAHIKTLYAAMDHDRQPATA